MNTKRGYRYQHDRKDGMKTCCRCNKTKPLSEFNKDRSRPDGYAYSCRQCNKERQREYGIGHREELSNYQREYYIKHPEKRRGGSRRSHLLSKYGITLREYDLMLRLQEGGCAICDKTPEENGRRLAVDHDHETGEIRGLLCSGCNAALGFLNDDPELCELAKLYLYEHGK